MEYQKIIKLLDITQNQSTKFRTKKWVKVRYTLMERITALVKLSLKLQC